MKNLLAEIKTLAPAYGSIPFWSWNDRLEPEELRRQIRVMKDLGMSGFFMHARGGLETEYLSDEWFAAVDACVDEAEKLGMEAWSYDENGRPLSTSLHLYGVPLDSFYGFMNGMQVDNRGLYAVIAINNMNDDHVIPFFNALLQAGRGEKETWMTDP